MEPLRFVDGDFPFALDVLHDQLRDFCWLLGKKRTGFICLVAACAGGTVVVEAERQFSVLRQLRTLIDDRYNARLPAASDLP